MNQLDDDTRRALCAADQPPPGVEDRVLAAILGAGGGPGPDGGGTSSAGSGGLGSATIVHAAKVVGATLGLAAGGLALLAITAAGVRAIPEAKPQQQASARVEASLEPREVVADQADQVAAIEDTPEAEPLAQPALAEVAPAASAIRSVPTQKPALAELDGTIEAELALMKAARSSKDHQRALATLDRHRREFATGVFAAEREVLRVEHLCALGRTGEAEAVAAAFIARYPDNPLRSRVDPACAN